jgi:ribosome-associated toxin RatA of RatAB toxin-antitoxin module
VPIYEGRHEAVIAARPDDTFATLTDYEHLHEWQGSVRRATVLNRDDRGRGRDVEYEIDAWVRTVRYVLRHTYDAPSRIDSQYLRGDFATFEGFWRFDPQPGGRTRALVDIRIDPGLRLPGRIVRLLQRRVLQSAVEDLRRHLEQ